MKHVYELVGDYLDENPEEFERGEVGIVLPDGTDERVVGMWLERGGSTGGWATGLRGATKEDACGYAKRVLAAFYHKGEAETVKQILKCVNAFADWTQGLTEAPEVVLSYCGWMRSELRRRWQEPFISWPWVAVELTLCELSIRSYHRIGSKEAERELAMLVLNAAHFFDPHPSKPGTEEWLSGLDTTLQ